MFERWENLCSRLGVPGVIKHQTFKMLMSAYGAPSVFYHNWEHIKWCLKEVDELPLDKESSTYLLIETSIWFHDVVYNPQSKTNEEDSAFYAEKFLNTSAVHKDFTRHVSNIIKATKHTFQPDLVDIATSFTLDIDLASLGFLPEVFSENSEQIYKEYAPFVESKELYGSRRAKFMLALLERPRIYYTDFFYKKYEEQARSNITTLCSN